MLSHFPWYNRKSRVTNLGHSVKEKRTSLGSGSRDLHCLNVTVSLSMPHKAQRCKQVNGFCDLYVDIYIYIYIIS